MAKKSIKVQLSLFGVLIATFIGMSVIDTYSTGIILLDALMNASKGFFLIIGLVCIIPFLIMGFYEFFHKGEEYEPTLYFKVSIICFQVCFLILYAIVGAGVFSYFVIYLPRILQPNLVLTASLILTLSFLWIIWYFIKNKLGFSILDIFYYRQFGRKPNQP